MAYKVAIRKNETGEVRIAEQEGIDWNDSSYFWWTEGDFGCDCNREVEFEHAGEDGIDADKEDVIPCGNGRFTVLYAELPDGTRIKLDEEGETN